MKRVLEIGVDNGGTTQPIASLPADLRASYEAISAFGRRPGEARKALHSAIVMDGWGTEVSSLFSEHGTNAILPGGVYSLAPFQYYLDVGHAALESIQRKSGVEKMFARLTGKLKACNGVSAVITENGEQVPEAEQNTFELPGFSSLPLPTPEEWLSFCSITDTIGRTMQAGHRRDELRRLLLLCLLESGVPLKNLCRYRRYYRFGSFVFIDGKPAYFVALIRQSDCGLGLMPLQLKRPEVVSWILVELKRYFDCTPERAIFGDFEFNVRILSEFVNRLVEIPTGAVSRENVFGILDRGATFAGLLALGGFLTTALRDELLQPANYYHVGDLLAAVGIPRVKLMGIDGNSWRDPYAPTQTQMQRALDLDGVLILLIENKERKQGKGRPRQIPKPFRAIGQRYKSWPDRTWAAFIARLWPQPSKSRIRKLLIESGTCDNKTAWARAIRVFNEIGKNGWLASARPLRLLPPAALNDFLERVETEYLPAVVRSREKQRRFLSLIATLATLGCRPQEGLRICKRDFTAAPGLRLLRLHGTKSNRARREMPLGIFASGPCGLELAERWRTAVDDLFSDASIDAHPLFASSREAIARYENMNDVLRTAFEKFTGSDAARPGEDKGSFTAYSLRHAAAIRLVQAGIDGDFLHGNFQAALAEAASALGHSYPVFLSCYLGTAALLLVWPAVNIPQQ